MSTSDVKCVNCGGLMGHQSIWLADGRGPYHPECDPPKSPLTYADGLRRGAEIARKQNAGGTPAYKAGFDDACSEIAAAIESEIKDTPK